MMDRVLLLNPGPVTLTERVRQAMLAPDLCHREPEFADLTRDILAGLEQVYPDCAQTHDAALLTGSGSAAVEAMLQTFAPADATTLVVANGIYGERMAAMLQAMHRPCRLLAAPWEAAPDLSAVATLLQQHDDIRTLAVVHHETTTGRLNRLDGLASLCRQHQVDLLVDAVSSFGAEALDFAAWQPAAVAGSANKCLHGVPGLSFVLGRRTLLQAPGQAAGSLYLDLRRYHAEQRNGFSPFTQAVQAAYALREALHEYHEAGGMRARHARYAALAAHIREHMQAMGLRLLIDEQDCSCCLSTFHLPPSWSYRDLHDLLRSEGYVIYAAQGRLQPSFFRIANMGDLRDADIDRLLEVFRRRVVSRAPQ